MFTETGGAPLEAAEDFESKFGDKEVITKALAETDIDHIHQFGQLTDAFEQYSKEFGQLIPDHSNVVELVKILGDSSSGENNVVPLEIETANKDNIFAVFKPISGESEARKDEYKIDYFAPNEAIAYRISEHFNLDIVPPTTLRYLGENNLGSIQYFLDPFNHGLFGHVFPEYDSARNFRTNPDFQKMAILDYLLLNADRNNANFMVDAKLTGKQEADGLVQPKYEVAKSLDQLRFYGIDNGYSFSTEAFIHRHFQSTRNHLGGIPGPMRYMTTEPKTQELALSTPPKIETQPLAEHISLPQDIKDKLEQGLSQFDSLRDPISFILDLVHPNNDRDKDRLINRKLELMQKRAENLLSSGHFLSPHNSTIEKE